MIQVFIVFNLRIDKIGYRHVYDLAWTQNLLGKTEAIDLVKIIARSHWGHIVGRSADQRFIGQVTCLDRKSTRLNSSHDQSSYAVFCLKKKKKKIKKKI